MLFLILQVQMARTFLFFWVFSLPLVLVADVDDSASTIGYTIHDTVEALLIIFFCTYGFLGLEYVSMEMDDPYGEDPNDFPGQLWSHLVFDDIYYTIGEQDGAASAAAVRARVRKREQAGGALENFQQNRTGIAESVREGARMAL